MNNLDPQEITKFEAVAHDWWNKNGEFKPLHDINPLRMQFIQEQAQLSDKKVLDVGCGGGILTESLAKERAIVTGIDMAERSLDIARKHATENNLSIDYQHITAEAFAQQQAHAYDVVTCLEMLEHVPEPSSVVRACAELVKPGGHLFFSTLNRNLKAYTHAILGAEYILGLLPRGTHDYAKFIRPSELDAWARKAGLTCIAIAGITYHPLTQEYRLSDDVSVNYLVCFQSR